MMTIAFRVLPDQANGSMPEGLGSIPAITSSAISMQKLL
jgi:hypothetical protein